MQHSSEARGWAGISASDYVQTANNIDFNNFICKNSNAADYFPDFYYYRYTIDEPACQEEYIQGYVMARFEGSGRMNRLWIVTKPDVSNEILRVYIDDMPEPFIQVKIKDILSGNAGTLFKEPFLEKTFSKLVWMYPAVFSSKFIISIDRLALDMFYYQVDAVKDRSLIDREAEFPVCEIRDSAISMLSADSPSTGAGETINIALMPGEQEAVLNTPGPGTVQSCTVRFAEIMKAQMEEVTLSVWWDDNDSAGIDVPLLDIFSASLSLPNNSSLALRGGSNAGQAELSLRLPMPFADHAYWTVTHNGSGPVSFEIEIVMTDSIPEQPFGNLNVQRFETLGPYTGLFHPLVRISDRVRLAGVCMMMEGHKYNSPYNHEFLEGDELGFIDGVRALGGTGTEDYFNSSWYFSPANDNASPFAQWWGVGDTGESGEASACRWHVLSDTIDFQESMELSIEIGPGEPLTLDRYRSVAFIYY